LPDIRYEQFTLHDIHEIEIRLDGAKTGLTDLISIRAAGASMKSHLATLDNEGLEFEYAGALTFDLQGRMNGTLYTTTEQSLQLIVPGAPRFASGSPA